ADFAFAPTTVDAGAPVSFAASVSAPASGFTVAWDFGDGADATGLTATHAFLTAGSHVVALVVKSAEGATARVEHRVDVIALPETEGRAVKGLVTVLAPYGPGDADAMHAAPRGLTVQLVTRGKNVGATRTDASGAYALDRLPGAAVGSNDIVVQSGGKTVGG